jgi:hypothetical protein
MTCALSSNFTPAAGMTPLALLNENFGGVPSRVFVGGVMLMSWNLPSLTMKASLAGLKRLAARRSAL